MKKQPKRTKFVGDYAGEIVVIGFTGDANEIQKYLEKTFGIKQEGKYMQWSKETKFCIEVAPHVIAHVEPYPNAGRRDLKLRQLEPCVSICADKECRNYSSSYCEDCGKNYCHHHINRDKHSCDDSVKGAHSIWKR